MPRIDINYEEFLISIIQIIPNMDADLMVKICIYKENYQMYLQEWNYMVDKSGVDTLKKQEQIRAKHRILRQTSSHEITRIRQMNIDLIEKNFQRH